MDKMTCYMMKKSYLFLFLPKDNMLPLRETVFEGLGDKIKGLVSERFAAWGLLRVWLSPASKIGDLPLCISFKIC